MEPTRDQLAELARLVASTAPREIDCEAVLDRVAAYLEAHDRDAQLPDELREVRQHLAVCPQCREEFDALVRAHGDAGSKPD